MKLKVELFLRSLPIYLPFTIVVLCLAFILGKLIEGIVFLISYTIFRHAFKVEMHKDTTSQCIHVSLLVFAISLIFILPNEISLMFACVSGIILNFILSMITIKTTNIRRSMDKDILLAKCENANLNNFETTILTEFYCNRTRLQDIADKCGYSIERINQIKKEALRKIS